MDNKKQFIRKLSDLCRSLANWSRVIRITWIIILIILEISRISRGRGHWCSFGRVESFAQSQGQENPVGIMSHKGSITSRQTQHGKGVWGSGNGHEENETVGEGNRQKIKQNSTDEDYETWEKDEETVDNDLEMRIKRWRKYKPGQLEPRITSIAFSSSELTWLYGSWNKFCRF